MAIAAIVDVIVYAAILNIEDVTGGLVLSFGLPPNFSLCDSVQQISRGLERGIEFDCLLERGPGLLCLPGAPQHGSEIGTDQEHCGVDGESLVPEFDGLIHPAELHLVRP